MEGVVAEKLIARFESSGLHWFSDDPVWLAQNSAGSFDTAELLQRSSDNPDGFSLAVPGDAVLLRYREVASGERRYLNDSLPFMFEENLAGDVELLHFVHRERGAENIVAAMVSRREMDDWQQCCAEHGIAARRWLPEYLLLPLTSDGLTVVIEGDRALVRTGPDTGFVTDTPLLETLLRLHCDETETFPEVLTVFSRDEGDARQWIGNTLSSVICWQTGDFYTATLSSNESWHDTNLLQGDYMPRLPWVDWWHQWRSVAAVLLLAFVIQLVASYTSLAGLESENLALRQAMEATYRSVNPSGNALDPERKLASQLAGLEGGASGVGVVELIQRVGIALEGHSSVELESINFTDRNGDLRLNLVAADFQTVDAIRTGFEEAGLQAVLQNSSSQGDRVRARVLIKGA
jgi:type II secretion system protein L